MVDMVQSKAITRCQSCLPLIKPGQRCSRVHLQHIWHYQENRVGQVDMGVASGTTATFLADHVSSHNVLLSRSLQRRTIYNLSATTSDPTSLLRFMCHRAPLFFGGGGTSCLHADLDALRSSTYKETPGGLIFCCVPPSHQACS